jgi:predicted ATP-grasp superfamily ATP-dependent carboligase
MRSDARLPPAILLGADSPIGLTIIRELGEHGVPVHAIARSREGIGLYSKWATARYLRPGDDRSTIELLNRIAAEQKAAFLLAISERDLIMIRAAADTGRLVGLRPLVPEAAQLKLVLDKSATYAIAREVGVPVPATWQPQPGPGRKPPIDLTFPCVLKWGDPESLGNDLATLGIPFLKAEYCHGQAELERALGRYDGYGRYPLVQEFCPGGGLGHMMFLHNGQVVLRLQHRRVSEWPPEGGYSTVCESLPLSLNTELLVKSEALLKRIGWQGAAMVEYRLDPRSGRAALMEINGRFWGSLPLAYHAGAPFAWFTYSVLALGVTPVPPRYRAGVRCRFMIPETRRLLTLTKRRGQLINGQGAVSLLLEICRFVYHFFSLKTRYYVFTARDPMPFIIDMCFAFRRAFRRKRIQPRFPLSAGLRGES